MRTLLCLPLCFLLGCSTTPQSQESDTPTPAARDAAAPAQAPADPDPAAPPSDTPASATTEPAADAAGQKAAADEGEWIQADVPASTSKSVTKEEGRAPDFVVTTLDGRTLDSTVLYGTKPVSITLWATWCQPCLLEIPVIQKLYDQYGTEIEFIAISLDDPKAAAAVTKMVEQRKITYPVAHDTAMKVATDFQAMSIPLTLFVDREGRLVERLEGFGGEAHLIKAFEKAFLKDGAVAQSGGTSI